MTKETLEKIVFWSLCLLYLLAVVAVVHNLLKPCDPIEDKAPVVKKVKPKEYPISKWKPKPPGKELNQLKWAGQGFALTTRMNAGIVKKPAGSPRGIRGA